MLAVEKNNKKITISLTDLSLPFIKSVYYWEFSTAALDIFPKVYKTRNIFQIRSSYYNVT